VVWGDILLPGRTRYAKAPERFAFDRFIQELRVHRGDRLVHHERLAWFGPWGEDEIRWHFGDAEAVASLFISGALADEVIPDLPDGEVAVQETAAGDTCVRIAGRDAEQLIAVAARIALTSAAQAACDPSPWFLDTSCLAGSHWFSPVPNR
jgi:urease accessory protein UreH